MKGTLSEERIFVRRPRESRMGFYIMAPLLSSTRKQTNQTSILENGAIINLGWIPADHKEEILDKIKKVCMLLDY